MLNYLSTLVYGNMAKINLFGPNYNYLSINIFPKTEYDLLILTY